MLVLVYFRVYDLTSLPERLTRVWSLEYPTRVMCHVSCRVLYDDVDRQQK